MTIDPALRATFIAATMLDVITPLRPLRAAFVAQGFDLMLVGGAVRDVLCGRLPQDIDLSTDANPDEQEAIYKGAGFTHHDTGLRHGTWTVVIDHIPYEITSLRTRGHRDGPAGSPHAAYTRDWSLDLERRDLTINAMAMDFDFRLIDPFGGEADLRKQVIRFVGRAEDRIGEDPLRMLRWLRFSGSHGTGAVDEVAFEAVRQLAPLLRGVARERVWKEIARIVSGQRPVTLFTMLLAGGIGEGIDLPKLADERRCWQFAVACEGGARPEVRLACYLDDETMIRDLAERWKWANEERLLALAVHRLLKRLDTSLSLDTAKRLVATKEESRDTVFEALKALGERDAAMELLDWKAPVFPVRGGDLVARGIPTGPKIGDTLRELSQRWAAGGYTESAHDLVASLQD